MTQRLSALAVLAENQGSVLSTHVAVQNCLLHQGISYHFLSITGTYPPHIYMLTDIHIHKIEQILRKYQLTCVHKRILCLFVKKI